MKKIYLLSLLMAIIVGVSVYLFANNLQQQTMAKIEANRSSVVVALQYIPANTEITGEMVTLQELPTEAINPLAARKLDDVIGTIAQFPIEPQEQVFTTRVKKRGEAAEGRLSYILEPGYRAITLGVDELSGVAGNITRGDYVDLIVTMRNAELEEKNDISFLIIENLQVLATGKKINAKADTATTQEYASITLAASPEDAIKIHYASQFDIRLALRAVLDDKITGETYYPTVFPTEAGTGG